MIACYVLFYSVHYYILKNIITLHTTYCTAFWDKINDDNNLISREYFQHNYVLFFI